MYDVDVLLISFIMSSPHELYDGSMGRQQNLLLLCLFLGEQEQIFSHTWNNVTIGGYGIISLVFDDYLESLPSWEVFHIFCSSIRGVFDKEHVKEHSFVLTRDYLHELTALSLWSRNLWMECPWDHFTFDALGG